MRREIKAYIEAELRDYHQTKKDLEEALKDVIEENFAVKIDDVGGSPGNIVSRPVEVKAIKLLTNRRIKKMDEIVSAIDDVVSDLDEPKYRLIEMCYWTKPNYLKDIGIARELNIDRSTFYRWRDIILEAISEKMGLMKNCDNNATKKAR